MPTTQPVIVVNPKHAIVERRKGEVDDQRLSDWTVILFDQALLAEDGQFGDQTGSAKRLNTWMLATAGPGRLHIRGLTPCSIPRLFESWISVN